MAFNDLVAGIDRAIQASLGGETVSYAPLVGDPVPLVGVFDESYELGDLDEPGRSGVTPSVWFATAELAKLATTPDDDDPRITIRAVVYSVWEVKPDGSGSMRLLLKVAP